MRRSIPKRCPPKRGRYMTAFSASAAIFRAPISTGSRRPGLPTAWSRSRNTCYEVSFEERIVEVAVLAIARHWRARYVWTSHAPAAVKAGVDAAIVEAIRTGAAPVFARQDEAACFAFCRALVGGNEVDDALWARTRDIFGERGIAEIMGLIGLYSAVCATMVAYRVPTKGGEPDPFASA